MNFHELNVEMKRTLLEASVGRVTISSHNLENILKIILFLHLGVPDEKFDIEWEKPRTLGKIICELKKFGGLTEMQLQKLDSTRNLRNRFTHRLSEIYVQSVESGAMYELIQDFEKMKREIDATSKMAKELLDEQLLDEQAKRGGVNVGDLKRIARQAVDTWENS